MENEKRWLYNVSATMGGGRPVWADPVASARRLFATRRKSKQLAATIVRIPHTHLFRMPQHGLPAELRADCPLQSITEKMMT